MRKFLAWWTFERLVVLLLTINLIDGVSTHILLHLSGPEAELNPLMRWAWMVSPELFWLMKIGLVGSGLMVIGKYAPDSVARAAVVSINAFYMVVLVTHLHGWIAYLGGA